MPHVSVIIPAYNYDRFVGQAVTSVLGQSWRDLDVLVVDDGSTDGTGEVVNSIQDRRLRYLFQPNQGLSAARNAGLRHTDSTYVAFLDADDYWLPQKLELQLRAIERMDRIGLVYGGYHVVDEVGAPVATRRPRVLESDWLRELLLGNFVAGSATTSLLRRDCFERAGVFNETLNAGEDWDMWIRVAQNYAFGVVDAPIAAIRVHAANMTSNVGLMDQALQAVLDNFFRRSDIPRDLHDMQRQARARAKVCAAVFALRRKHYGLAARLALAALRYDLANPDAYTVVIKSMLQQWTA